MIDPKDVALRYAARRVAKTYTVNKGDLVWYGKYKNQRGKVKNFGMGDKGDPTITVEQLPAPSARKPKKKSPKTLNLFSIRPRKEDEHDKAGKEAGSKALSKKEVPKADGKGTTTIYEYGPRQVAQRAKSKAVRIESLRQKMSDLRKGVHDDLTAQNPQIRLTALGISLMDETYARVGNEKSAKNGHHGVTNWTVAHVALGPKSATIKYTGKSGVKQEKKVTNAQVLKALRRAISDKSADDKILCEGDECDVLAKDINAYLKPFGVTAKDIRGMHANEEMKKRLRVQRKAGPSLPRSRKDKDKILKAEFKAALELAAAAVGHEPSTLRGQYLVPSMEASYTHDGTVLDRLDKKATLSDSEKEDRESARLVRQSPKFKPPRRDKERGRIKDTAPDTDPDESQDQKDRSNNYKDASARVALRFLLGDPTIRLAASKRQRKKNKKNQSTAPKPTPSPKLKVVPPAPASTPEREERAVGDTWEGKDGKWSAKGKDKIQGGFTSDDAAKDWLTGGPGPGGGAPPAPPAAPAKKAPAKKAPATPRAYAKEMKGAVSGEGAKVLSGLHKDLLAGVAAILGTRDQTLGLVFDAAKSKDTSSLEETAQFAERVLGRIPKEKKPSDRSVAEAEEFVESMGAVADLEDALDPLEDALESSQDEYDDLKYSGPDGSASATEKKKHATLLAAAKESVGAAKAGVTLAKADIKKLQKAEALVKTAVAWETAPEPQEIADALVSLRAAEVRKDPLMLDPSKPVGQVSKDPLPEGVGGSKEFMGRMADVAVSAMTGYRVMAAEDRATHKKGLEEHLKGLESEGVQQSEQYATALSQLRGLHFASAVEDGDDAKGVNPAFQTLLLAAKKQGDLEKFVRLNLTGAAEGDSSAQEEFRSSLRKTPPTELRKMVSDDHPAQAVLAVLSGAGDPPREQKGLWSRLTGGDGVSDDDRKNLWMQHMDSESLGLLQELAEDMILDDVLFTDMDLVRQGKSTGDIKKDKKRNKDKEDRNARVFKSPLDQLAAAAEATLKELGLSTDSPTPKGASTSLSAYNFVPWGVLLSPQGGNPPR